MLLSPSAQEATQMLDPKPASTTPSSADATRRVRLTGTLSDKERAIAAAAVAPSEDEQQRYLAEFAAAVATMELGKQ
jgi:hypothetical protein